MLTVQRVLTHSTANAAGQQAVATKPLAKAGAREGQAGPTRRADAYALITTLPSERATPAQVLIYYKGQGAVERRYADFPGPLAVTPVFVQHNCRAVALIQVTCLALLVFCLIERQARRALGTGQTVTGLYPDNLRARPISRILYHLAELNLCIGNVTDPPTIPITRGVQLHRLDLLDVDIRGTSWPQT
ncbi:hypothetical protein AB0L75_36620 [Streptomyces sp. NPDC052101]|uniref:hypothetical protein n=1 Tax=Streptomyces sp. NPDC052101 TaxID=3155763 RepID=UPI003446EA48